MARESLRVQVRESRLQAQPGPLMAVGVRPNGTLSVTSTVPPVAALPTLPTTMVYVLPVCPCAKFPRCVAWTVRSGAWRMVVASLALLFAELESPPPETLAVLVRNAGAVRATFTRSVIGEAFEPAPMEVVRVQVAVAGSHVQPEPNIETADRPSGSTSVT